MKKYAILSLILLCWADAAGYTRITLSSGQTPKWSAMPVSYWINESGLSQLSNGSEFQAVNGSFQTWQNVQTADVRFIYRGTTSTRTVGRDGINLISFADDSTPLGSSVIAATFSFFRSDSGAIVTDEADIIFNPAFQYSTSGEENKFDIQSVLTHEIGHLLGLDHAALISSVMVPFAAVSQLDQRTLSYDDIAGVSEIYPKASTAPAVGQIRGIIQTGAAAVFGAHVVALERDGTALVSTLSQPDGSYVLGFLPAGAYRLMAEPLDLPVTEQNIGGGATSFYRNLKVDFGTTYFGNVGTLTEAQSVDVVAGSATAADIQVLPRSSTGLNLTRPGFAFRFPLFSRATLRLGGEDIAEGVSFTTSSTDLVLGPPTFGGRVSSTASTSASMDLSVSSTTPLGPKNVAVNRGDAASVVTGAIVITDVPPLNVSVGLSAGPVEGGTLVTITGANLRPGAQVFFAGLPASDVRVVNPGTIQATTPRGTPGVVNVVVMNSDGTWTVAARAFTYFSAPPTIARVSPLSGPPSTPVVIEGDHFDTRPQNIDVRFNGAAARVMSATTSSISVIVPFGATSGPITVTAYGQTATGPDFLVTSAPSSSNLAAVAYNFIDATISSGGTKLSFSNSDDATALVGLPFTFSLFRDIYPVDSRISIATNGWLSLEPSSNAEFQNASLPAQSVTRPNGSVDSVPSSLIAPFWDDLILGSESSVNTRTIGVTPNRQFIVEWSNMSILDEGGRNLTASVTFEAILFEGTNDIQFVYQNMTGPRSDGSSATIGSQDLKRTTAFLSSFNQAFIRSESFVTYRFQNGNYTVAAPDATPPTRPVVTDGGAATQSRTELWASWTAEDPESGIREFQYAIGRTPGATDVRAYTSTAQNAAVAGGLNLDIGVKYYFAVRAVNSAGLTSDAGVSDGIRVDPTFQPEVKVIASAPHGFTEYSGIALYSPAPMTVVLKAMDSNGALLSGAGVRNPTSITLAAGQQYARLIPEIFGTQTFDGWIETEASGTGLGIYTVTGSWDATRLDGSVVRGLSSDFVLFHNGASAILVNPSTRTANVTLTAFGTANVQSVTIPPRSRLTTTIFGVTRIQASEALAALERLSSSGKLEINAAVPMSAAQSTLVFPQAVTGRGYASVLTVANVSSMPQTLTITYGSSSTTLQLLPNASIRASIASLLQLSSETIRTGAVRVTAATQVFAANLGSLVGILDIENETSLVSIGAAPAATETSFAHVAQGNGLFTGLAFAAGDRAATILVEVYAAAGGLPKSATISLAANSQLAGQLKEIVPTVTTEIGGHVRILSDQPIWTWAIYGSGQAMASGPPL